MLRGQLLVLSIAVAIGPTTFGAITFSQQAEQVSKSESENVRPAVSAISARFPFDEATTSPPASAPESGVQDAEHPDGEAEEPDDSEPQPGLLQRWLEEGCPQLEMQRRGFAITGWLEQGFTWNPDNPAN